MPEENDENSTHKVRDDGKSESDLGGISLRRMSSESSGGNEIQRRQGSRRFTGNHRTPLTVRGKRAAHLKRRR